MAAVRRTMKLLSNSSGGHHYLGDGPDGLTSREHQILQLIWSGLKNKEMAARLRVSVKTVEAHRANMMKKFRVSNTAQLLKAAIQGRMITLR